MNQSSTRLIRTDAQHFQNFFSQIKQQIKIKCKHCNSQAVRVKTPNGNTLYYCGNKSCNFSGKIQRLFIKTNNEEKRFLYY